MFGIGAIRRLISEIPDDRDRGVAIGDTQISLDAVRPQLGDDRRKTVEPILDRGQLLVTCCVGEGQEHNMSKHLATLAGNVTDRCQK